MNGDVDENVSKEEETSLEDSYGTQARRKRDAFYTN